MTVVMVFLAGMGLAVAGAAALVGVLRPHLLRLLDEVCESEARAGFWAVTSLVTIALVTLLFSTLTIYPDGDPGGRDLFFGLVGQLRAGLVGLLGSLLTVAGILVSTIRRFERRGLPAPTAWRPEPPLLPMPGAAAGAGE
jgi:hypothetical protein